MLELLPSWLPLPVLLSVPRATLPVALMVLLAVATWASLKLRLTALVSSAMLSVPTPPLRLPDTVDPVATNSPS